MTVNRVYVVVYHGEQITTPSRCHSSHGYQCKRDSTIAWVYGSTSWGTRAIFKKAFTDDQAAAIFLLVSSGHDISYKITDGFMITMPRVLTIWSMLPFGNSWFCNYILVFQYTAFVDVENYRVTPASSPKLSAYRIPAKTANLWGLLLMAHSPEQVLLPDTYRFLTRSSWYHWLKSPPACNFHRVPGNLSDLHTYAPWRLNRRSTN